MIRTYRVLVGALFVFCGLLCPRMAHAATLHGRHQRFVEEDSTVTGQVTGPPPPPPVPLTTPTPTRRSTPTPRPAQTPGPTKPSTPPSLPPLTAASLKPARMLLAAINHDRAAHKVPPLTLDIRQSQCSLGHSRHMAQMGYISHDQFPGDLCVRHAVAGENVGAAYGSTRDAVLYLHGVMLREGPCVHHPCSLSEFAAHGHYTNLVNPQYTHIGIGIYGKNGITWLTEDFVE